MDMSLLIACAVLACMLVALLIVSRRRNTPRAKKWLVIDGSNVMHWKDGKPSVETLREVIQHLRRLGYTPGIMFDANAGYLLTGKYEHDGTLARLLDLPTDRVMVVPKGTPADPAILTAARDLGARVVTNDQFRDWVEDFPEVIDHGYLIKGSYADGALRLPLASQPT